MALGLDLGISFSRFCLFKDNRFELIPDEQGHLQTPSYVAFTDSHEILVGEDAKNQLLTNPSNTVFNFKRLLGRRFSDPAVQEEIRGLPYKVEKGPGDRPLIVVQYQKEIRKYYPEEIQAIMIRSMKKYAETYLGIKNLTKVVVTIPVYFSKPQIAATISSCNMAGLEVLRTLKESQAIALGLYHQNTDKQDRNTLVINLGGGSLDVAMILISEQIFEVKSMHGDTTLGGIDFVRRLMDYCIFEHKAKNQEDILGNLKAIEKLRV